MIPSPKHNPHIFSIIFLSLKNSKTLTFSLLFTTSLYSFSLLTPIHHGRLPSLASSHLPLYPTIFPIFLILKNTPNELISLLLIFLSPHFSLFLTLLSRPPAIGRVLSLPPLLTTYHITKFHFNHFLHLFLSLKVHFSIFSH